MIFSKKNVADYLNVVVIIFDYHLFFFFGQSWYLNRTQLSDWTELNWYLNLIHSIPLQWENSLPSHLYSWSSSCFSWYISIDFPPWGTIRIVCFHLLPSGPDSKESAYNAGDPGSIPVLGRSPGEGNGYPFQYFAWRSPWTEQPGGLQLMGSQRVRHYWARNTLSVLVTLASLLLCLNYSGSVFARDFLHFLSYAFLIIS